MHNTHDHVNKLKLKCSCIERPSCCKLLLLAWKILNLSLPPPPKKKNKRNMWISEYTIHTQYNHIHYTCIDLYICLGWSVATMIFVIKMLKMFWTRDKIKWFSQCMTIAWHLSMISIVCTLIKNGKLVNQIATLQLIVVKISQRTSNHLYQHLHTYNHVSRWPSSPLPALPPPPPPFLPHTKNNYLPYSCTGLLYLWMAKEDEVDLMVETSLFLSAHHSTSVLWLSVFHLKLPKHQYITHHFIKVITY